MKKVMKTFAAFLLVTLTSTRLFAADLDLFDTVEPRESVPTITINATAHPIRLPLESLANTLFIGDNGEIINYSPSKGLYASVITSEKWGHPDIQLNKAPAYIFEENVDAVSDPALKDEIRGISRIVLEPKKHKKIGKMIIGNTTVFIAYSLAKTNLFLTSPDKPNLYTQVVMDGFTWDEVVNEILKGIGSE